MFARIASGLVVSLGLLSPSAAAQGGTTPITSHVTDLDMAPFTGPGIAMTAFGPEVGEPIVNARLEVTFKADGVTPASDLLLQFTVPAGTSFTTWQVTGADLGFPSASGTYSGTLETDVLNGVVFRPAGLPFTPMDIAILPVSGELWGTVQGDFILEIGPQLEADVATVSLSAQGVQTLDLNAGPTAGPGLLYILVGSESGTTPALIVDQVAIPLVFDAYTTYTLLNPNGPVLGNSLGLLDASGTATATFRVPPGLSPSLAGTVLHHSFAVFEPGLGALLSASNAVSLTLVP